jgi:hypothetical protein
VLGFNDHALAQLFDYQTTWIVHAAMAFGGSGDVDQMISLWDISVPACHVSLKYNSAFRRFDVYRGTSSPVQVYLGSSADNSVSASTWHHVIFKAVINDVTGAIEVRLDGATIINLTSVDTRNNGGSASGANQVSFSFCSIHDIVICDGTGAAPYNGIIGDMTVKCLIPDAAGSSSGWTPSAGSNYQNVDDTTPDTDTTYNSTAVAGTIDSYALPNPTLSGTCRGIQMTAFMRKDDAGARTARVRLYDGTAYNGTTVNLADSYSKVDHIWPLHPGTGVAFTAAQLNAAEAGVELVS